MNPADGRFIYLKAVNTYRQQPLETTITLKGAPIGSQGRVETIGSTSSGAFNHFATPEAVSIRSSQIKVGDRFTLELPPASVSVITMDVLRSSSSGSRAGWPAILLRNPGALIRLPEQE